MQRSCQVNYQFDNTMIIRIILGMSLLSHVTLAFADQVLDGLNHFFTEVKTLDAEFDQQVFDEQGKIVQQSRGRLKLSRPGRFRWETVSPAGQLIVADGRNLWIYDIELEQASVKPIDEMLAATPVTLLTELRPLEREFFIQQAPERTGLNWVRLIPKTQDTEFNRIELGLKHNEVRQMELHDQFGQKTVIRFTGMRSNQSIPESEFRFDAPPGVDIIGVEQ
jgi:outer membrane lipoprotein carrier protein